MTPSRGDPGDFQYEQRTPLYGGFSEADLVEQPAIELFSRLGWAIGNLFGEFSHGASAEGRGSRRDAILPRRLRRALKTLNPSLPDAALEDAYSTLTRERGAIDPIRANSEVDDLLRKGVGVEVRGKDGERKTEIVRVIDGTSRKPTTSSSPRRSGSPANSMPSAPISSASSTACRCYSSN
jgi:type I restriction enzyme R subunit